jgi:alkaline phosphatase D
VAVIRLKGLKPFAKYTCDVLIDGASAFRAKKPVFQSFPPKGQKAKFNIGFGGGARHNHPKERMWNVIAFLFMGDNLYIDDPEYRNRQSAYYYRRQLRPEYRRLSATTAICAIWDDHNLGKNDCSGGLDPFKPSWKVIRENWLFQR